MSERQYVKTVTGAIRFPHLAARDLEGRALELPDAFSGASNLVIVAFRREQQAMVDSWVAWWETIAAEHPSLRCYEIPVIATRWSPARAVIDGGMAQAVRDAGGAPSHAHGLHRRAARDRRARDRRHRYRDRVAGRCGWPVAMAYDWTGERALRFRVASGAHRWRLPGCGCGRIVVDRAVRVRVRLAVPSVPRADRCHFRYGARDAHGGAARGALRAVDVRNPDRQCARRVPHGPLPLVQGHRTPRVVRRPWSHLRHDDLKVVSACCCANPYRASLPSARFVTPGSPSRSPSPNGSSRRCADAQVSRERSSSAGARGGRDGLHRSPAGRRARRRRPSRAMPGPHPGQARRGALARAGRGRRGRRARSGVARSRVPRNRRGVLPGPLDRLAAGLADA